jgi:hypothetical protein
VITFLRNLINQACDILTFYTDPWQPADTLWEQACARCAAAADGLAEREAETEVTEPAGDCELGDWATPVEEALIRLDAIAAVLDDIRELLHDTKWNRPGCGSNRNGNPQQERKGSK